MSEFLSASILWVSLIFMVVGLFSVLVPILPGLLIMWLAAMAYGIVRGFGTLGAVVMIFITILVVAGSLADNLLMGAGARKGGASWLTILIALLAGVIGTVVFPPLGGFIAIPLAILALEYARRRNFAQAWQALLGLATGFGAAVAARSLIGLAVLGLWLLWVWKG